MLAPLYYVALALIGAAVAVPNAILPRKSGGHLVNYDQDLLSSCPGGPGSPNVEKADKCTLINIVNNPDTRKWTVLGDPQLNCQGGTQPRTLTLSGSATVSTSTTVDGDFGFDIEGLSIGGGISTSTTNEVTTSNSTTYTIPPGRQVVFASGVLQHSQTGNIQVNYGDKVDDHFIWFTNAKVTQLTPTNDVEYDTHETACGTDPRDFNNMS